MRTVAALSGALLVAAPVGPAASPSSLLTPTPEVSYAAPVHPLSVVRPFSPPVTRYGPGHLGVDLSVPAHAPVHPAGPGVVRFAGSVAGRGVVVVVHADGVRTEYEPLTVTVRVGVAVTTSTVLGRVTGTHGGCAPGRCLHWGARRGDDYFDPLTLLRPLGPVRLLPYP